MTAHLDHQKMQSLFSRAIELPQSERLRFIQDSCDCKAMRNELITLVSHHFEEAKDFLETPVVSEQVLQPGDRVDAYQILEPLGQGGMADVYLAKRVDGVFEKQFALKVMRSRFNNDYTRQRFIEERHILSRLEHPNIATIIDGGTTCDNAPYFVMEHIEGQAIDEYCRNKSLSIDAIIELFLQVCDAVSFAHRQLVLHCDLKPSNILVNKSGQVKLLDFGVATTLKENLVSELNTLGLTPRYASPEQIQSKPIDITSDIYSLGVVLYELSTQQSPYGNDDTLDQLLEKILHQSPPSLNIDHEISHTLSRGNTRLFKELDWILKKSLQKKPDQRYATVSGLAEDLNKNLQQRPVSAHPHTFVYQFSKFLVRHATGIAITSAALVLLCSIATLQQFRILTEKDRAIVERDKAEQVQQFLVNLFNVSNPSESLGNTITAREILDRGVDSIRDSDQLPMTTRTQLLTTMANVYRELGLYENALTIFEQSINKLRETQESNELAIALNGYGLTLLETAKYEQAKENHREALSLFDAQENKDNRAILNTTFYLAQVSRRQGEFQEAEGILKRLVSTMQTEDSEYDEVKANALREWGVVSMEQGDYVQAESQLQQALTIDKALFSSNHPQIANDYSKLGLVYRNMGNFEQAIIYHEQALTIDLATKDKTHPDVGADYNNIANIYTQQGNYQTAIAYLQKTLTIYQQSLGEIHDDTADTYNNIGLAYDLQGDNARAIQNLEKALAIRQQTLGPNHSDTAATKFNLGAIYIEEKKTQKAVNAFSEVLLNFHDSLGDQHPNVALTHSFLAVALAQQNRNHEALDNAEIAIATMTNLFGTDSPYLAYVYDNMAEMYLAMEKLESVKKAYIKSYDIRLKAFGEDHPETRSSADKLAKLNNEV